jgi:hypothetical protein
MLRHSRLLFQVSIRLEASSSSPRIGYPRILLVNLVLPLLSSNLLFQISQRSTLELEFAASVRAEPSLASDLRSASHVACATQTQPDQGVLVALADRLKLASCWSALMDVHE